MICPACGAELHDQAEYCSLCHKRVGAGPAEQTPAAGRASDDAVMDEYSWEEEKKRLFPEKYANAPKGSAEEYGKAAGNAFGNSFRLLWKHGWTITGLAFLVLLPSILLDTWAAYMESVVGFVSTPATRQLADWGIITANIATFTSNIALAFLFAALSIFAVSFARDGQANVLEGVKKTARKLGMLVAIAIVLILPGDIFLFITRVILNVQITKSSSVLLVAVLTIMPFVTGSVFFFMALAPSVAVNEKRRFVALFARSGILLTDVSGLF
jgi:hypothetical protein